jgi:hypothetical protein
MNSNQRAKNERNFDAWIEKEDGGRIYSFEIAGKLGWKAKYLKEVNNEEITLRFWQEIYDEHNVLREIHEKYPEDKGHKKL